MPFSRRQFLNRSGLSILPALLANSSHPIKPDQNTDTGKRIRFYGDGEVFEPADYLRELEKARDLDLTKEDRYGSGGAVQLLEEEFCSITGKQRAIYMPSGTMANQLAIATLSENRSKIFVQDESHVHRDEADAAQTVHHKRLMPLAKGKVCFTANELEKAIGNIAHEEVFATGIGAVSIENPVRRHDGRAVPLAELEKISAFCRQQKIPLHLDGARIHIAAAWSGNSVKDYAALFDTVYISLYKYLGAGGGAMLCGDKEIIDKMPHLVKIHGGSVYRNWTNAAMALHRLKEFDKRIKQTISVGKQIFAKISAPGGLQVEELENGTNIYKMNLDSKVNGSRLQEILSKQFNIAIARPNEKNEVFITLNETILYRPAEAIVQAFNTSLQNAG